VYDILVIGAGDVGTAIARELSRYSLRLAVVEAQPDVGAGTSKANTAILYTGFDAKPGTAEAQLVARGHQLLSRFAEDVGIPLERTGALLVAWDDEQLRHLPQIKRNAERNGYQRITELGTAELYRREPHLGPGALGALEIPDEHIVCPWTPPLACMTQALLAGADLFTDARVTAIDWIAGGKWRIATARGTLETTWVINAAGLYSDVVHRLAGYRGFTITPRRGELIVFDKLSRSLIGHVLLPAPTRISKGVVVAPTVFGNVLLGPTAENIDDKDDRSTTAQGLAELLEAGRRIMPELLRYEVTATYAGLRPAADDPDYQLVVDPEHSYACAGGVRSTGLTSSLAIAEWLRERLAEAGFPMRERAGGLPALTMPNLGEATVRPYADAERIAADPEYGRVVCFCERVTRGEIRDALHSPLPPKDLDGLRRRTRLLMGRCQGFFCASAVDAIWRASGQERAPCGREDQ
jgi:glycerol-3-phosphate dehydrogenase